MDKVVIIPARYQSDRLPGKVLRDLGGFSMLERTYQRAKLAQFERVIIATEDPQVVEHAQGFCHEVYLTSNQHQSGTERIAEVIEKAKIAPETIVVNLQADEPFMPPENIAQVAANLNLESKPDVATLCVPITDLDIILDPNAVKVVRNQKNMALYFSRASIPWDRNHFPQSMAQQALWFLHLGLYAYRAGFVTQLVGLPATQLEQVERLEQLRMLYYGHLIHVDEAQAAAPHGIDTVQDLERAREQLKKR